MTSFCLSVLYKHLVSAIQAHGYVSRGGKRQIIHSTVNGLDNSLTRTKSIAYKGMRCTAR